MDIEEVAVAVTYNPELDQFLLLRRSEDRQRFPGKWEFPSGFVEQGEDLRDAAVRELEEETGLVGTVMRMGEAFEVDASGYHYLIQPVLVKVESQSLDITGEHQDFRWAEISELESLEAVPNLEKDLEKVGIK